MSQEMVFYFRYLVPASVAIAVVLWWALGKVNDHV